MTIQIQKTADLQLQKLSVLIYGPAGSGKTRFSGTCAPRFKPLILSAESGLLSLKQLKDEKGQPLNFDYVTIDRWEQIDEIRGEIKHGRLKFDTIVIDSITEIQQICADRILKEERLEKLRIQDWGTLAQRMISTIRDFRNMEQNLIVTALTDTLNNEETGTSHQTPMVQGQLKGKLAQYFDLVLYLHAKTVKDSKTNETVVQRALITQGTQKILAKDRSGVLSPLEKPDFCHVFDKIFKPRENNK